VLTRRTAPEESTQIFVPDRTVGLIIGRGGETIRDIQDKSGCHVNIVGEAKSQNGQRPVNLIGSPQASEYARRLIMEIVESDTNGGPPGPPARAPPAERPQYGDGGGGAGGARITDTMRVPIDAVGMIIGKGKSPPISEPVDPEADTVPQVVKLSRRCKIPPGAESMFPVNSIPMIKSVKSLSQEAAMRSPVHARLLTKRSRHR
jgi:rRNA processing protein Krr1/Pno1